VNVNGAAIAAVAANAHTASASGLANDVSALILQQLRVPGTDLTLLAVLTDPAFTASGSTITLASFPSQFLARLDRDYEEERAVLIAHGPFLPAGSTAESRCRTVRSDTMMRERGPARGSSRAAARGESGDLVK
jgi:hypothetical protein